MIRIMNPVKIILLIGATLIPCGPILCQVNTSDLPVLKGKYLGQKPPADSPELFAPGYISTNTTEWTLTIMPDGKKLFSGRMAHKMETPKCIGFLQISLKN